MVAIQASNLRKTENVQEKECESFSFQFLEAMTMEFLVVLRKKIGVAMRKT